MAIASGTVDFPDPLAPTRTVTYAVAVQADRSDTRIAVAQHHDQPNRRRIAASPLPIGGGAPRRRLRKRIAAYRLYEGAARTRFGRHRKRLTTRLATA
jgi:hypothetical protein